MEMVEQFKMDVLNYMRSNWCYVGDVCEKFQDFKPIYEYILLLESEGYITIDENSSIVALTEMGKDCIKVV